MTIILQILFVYQTIYVPGYGKLAVVVPRDCDPSLILAAYAVSSCNGFREESRLIQYDRFQREAFTPINPNFITLICKDNYVQAGCFYNAQHFLRELFADDGDGE